MVDPHQLARDSVPYLIRETTIRLVSFSGVIALGWLAYILGEPTTTSTTPFNHALNTSQLFLGVAICLGCLGFIAKRTYTLPYRLTRQHWQHSTHPRAQNPYYLHVVMRTIATLDTTPAPTADETARGIGRNAFYAIAATVPTFIAFTVIEGVASGRPTFILALYSAPVAYYFALAASYPALYIEGVLRHHWQQTELA